MGTERDEREDGTVAGRRISRGAALRGFGGTGLALPGASGLPGATTAASAEMGQGPEQPNILVIMVDEMRDWQWFPEQAELDAQFPNMARLQNGAMRFGRHYTASNMCSPSRGSLLTRLYSHQTGFVLTQGSNTATLQGAGPDATPDAAVTPGATSVGAPEPPWPALDPRFPTWGTHLRSQGYETYWYGKWHVSDDSCDLEQYGFAGGTCLSPNGAPGEGLAEDPNIADQTIDWLQNQAGDAPWCTTVSFANPHDIQWYPR